MLAEREAQVTLRRPGDRRRPVGAHHAPPPPAVDPLERVGRQPGQPAPDDLRPFRDDVEVAESYELPLVSPGQGHENLGDLSQPGLS